MPVNPTSTQITPQTSVVSIPIDFNNTNGQLSKSHHLLIRVMNGVTNSDSENSGD